MLSVDFGYHQGKETDELPVSTRTVTFLSDFSLPFISVSLFCFCFLLLLLLFVCCCFSSSCINNNSVFSYVLFLQLGAHSSL